MSNRLPTAEPPPRSPRVVFLGMRCGFSVPPLEALISAGFEIAAVVLPGPTDGWATPPPARPLPMVSTGPTARIDQVARAASIPILTLRGLRLPSQIDLVRDLDPDVIAAACFPWRVPRTPREAPPLGCLNVHPSLLPRWRGPEPLFWTFRAGDPIAGVTIHLMDEGLDTGPILLQEELPLPPLADGGEIEHELATRGGRLLAQAIRDLAAGVARPRPRDDALARYAPTPTDADLVVHADLPAEALANIVAGIAPLWGPVQLELLATGRRIAVRRVVRVHAETPEAPMLQANGQLTIRCQPGAVTFAVD